MTEAEEKRAWEMSMRVIKMIDGDPKSFEAMLPCVLAYWIRKMDVPAEKLSREINEALAEQSQGYNVNSTLPGPGRD